MPQAASKNVSVKGCENNSFWSSADNFFRSCMLDRLLYATLRNFFSDTQYVGPSLENGAQDPEKEKGIGFVFLMS